MTISRSFPKENGWVRSCTWAFPLGVIVYFLCYIYHFIANLFSVMGSLYFLVALRNCVFWIILCCIAPHFQVFFQYAKLSTVPNVCFILQQCWMWRLPSITWWLCFFRRLCNRLVTTSHNIRTHYQLTHLLTESVTELYHIFETFLSTELYWFLSNTVSLCFCFPYFIIITSSICLGTDHKHTSLTFSYHLQTWFCNLVLLKTYWLHWATILLNGRYVREAEGNN